jgi:protein phosphatase
VRKQNEDASVCDADLGLFIVADGMGGHNAGEVASRLAIEAVRTFLADARDDDTLTWPFGIDPQLSRDANWMRTALRLANRRVWRASADREDYAGMGTTMAIALVSDTMATFGWVGDSRIYSYQDGSLEQLTRDDSWVASLLEENPSMDPVALAGHPMRNVLTKVIGANEDVDPAISERPLAPGQILLLCSDGLHGLVSAEEMRDVLASEPDMEKAAARLVQQALDRGAPDNVTVVLARQGRGVREDASRRTI